MSELFFIKEANLQVSGFTTVDDDVPATTDQRYILWSEIPVQPPFSSEDDAQERADEVVGMLIQGGSLVPPPEPDPYEVSLITVLMFRRRFTTAEKSAIYAAASTDSNVQLFLDDLSAASYVDVTDQETIDGVDYLISQGLLDASRRDAMLANEVIPADMPPPVPPEISG